MADAGCRHKEKARWGITSSAPYMFRVQASLCFPDCLEAGVIMWLSSNQWAVSRSDMQQLLSSASNISQSTFFALPPSSGLAENKHSIFWSLALKMGEPQDGRCLGPWSTTWRRANHWLRTFILDFIWQKINYCTLETSRHVRVYCHN